MLYQLCYEATRGIEKFTAMIILYFDLQPQFKYKLFHIYFTTFNIVCIELFKLVSEHFTIFSHERCCLVKIMFVLKQQYNCNSDPLNSKHFFSSYCFLSFWFQQHQLSVPATPSLAKPIVPQVGTEEMSSNVTDTNLPKGGTASQVLLAPECLLHQWRKIIVVLMRRDG